LKLTEQEVRYVADLANLRLTDEEVRKMQTDLEGILSHMDTLNEIDTSDVPAMAQVLFETEDTATLREDREQPTLGTETAVAPAPVSGAGYFKVPRVIER
jgi:aspartyl-tRNA(Asn)/glutamyl-tRNA(Gln) amidotransferase subunit C